MAVFSVLMTLLSAMKLPVLKFVVLLGTSALAMAVPPCVSRWIDSRFNADAAVLKPGAAFDEIRAAVNLVLAGALVALGTSLKLPLSTTYVTFMVAMGTSLADRAWGRESAVFRITGVLSVIGGWFITAACRLTYKRCTRPESRNGGDSGSDAFMLLLRQGESR